MTATAMTLADAAAMMAGWMTLSLLVGIVLGVVAWVTHHVVREHLPARLVWSAALFGAVLLSVALPSRQRTALVAPAAVPALTSAATAGLEASDGSALPRVAIIAQRALARVQSWGVLAAMATAHHAYRAPRSLQYGMLLVWPLATVSLLAVVVLGYRRHVRLLQRGELSIVDGTMVVLSERVGPAVIGVRTPRIVIPRWLLDRSADERALVLAHEQSHVDARDPVLLLIACGALVCLPWNPALWWMLSRLRLAIELDCDRRVLARGLLAPDVLARDVLQRRYGELLIDLSAAPSAVSRLAPIPAFSFHTTHLERRLLTMTARPSTHGAIRRTLALLVGSTGLLAACGAELPTSAELDGMDVAAAERRLAVVAPKSVASTYVLDGKEISSTEAKAIGAENIASIDVRRMDDKRSVISIRSKTASASVSDTTGRKRIVIEGVALRADGTADTTRRITMSSAPSSQKFEGLIYIDGVKSSSAAMNAITPDRIVSVEVIKGAAAEAKYGAEGAKGVIHIRTKK